MGFPKLKIGNEEDSDILHRKQLEIEKLRVEQDILDEKIKIAEKKQRLKEISKGNSFFG